MKTVYFVRHGQSEANVGNYVHGDHESPLTEHGRLQAARIAERCANLPIEIIIASDMVRALQTAGAISERISKPVEPSELFRERRVPLSVQRAPSGEEGERLYLDWVRAFYDPILPLDDGEKFDAIIARAGEALLHLQEREESTILVVTHGFFLRTLFAFVLYGRSVTREQLKNLALHLRMDNTGVTMLQYDPSGEYTYDREPIRGWCVRVWNDHAHLG